MTKNQKREAIDYAWNGMEWAQALQDIAETPLDLKIARSIYESFWCIYHVLVDERRKENRDALEK